MMTSYKLHGYLLALYCIQDNLFYHFILRTKNLGLLLLLKNGNLVSIEPDFRSLQLIWPCHNWREAFFQADLVANRPKPNRPAMARGTVFACG